MTTKFLAIGYNDGEFILARNGKSMVSMNIGLGTLDQRPKEEHTMFLRWTADPTFV